MNNLATASAELDMDLSFLKDLPAELSQFIVHRLSWLESARWNQLPPPNTNWVNWLLLAGRGFGKQLSLDCPIPTPEGWTTMGELTIGSRVFDEQGEPCTVIATFDAPEPESYRVSFSDGSSIDACGEHLWVTWEHRDRKQYMRSTPRVEFPVDWCAGRTPLDTAALRRTLTYGKRGYRNHCIPLARPLQLPEQELPVDPWLLGYWLGNGSRGSGSITAGSGQGQFDAPEVCQKVEALGILHSRNDDVERGQSRIHIHGLITALKDLGVADKSLVPAAYLRASVTQRQSLVQGLMDSDGFIGTNHHAEFCSMEPALADALMELLRSLSERPVLSSGRALLEGKDYGTKYRVTWRPSVFCPFTLSRKVERFVWPTSQALRLRHRMVMAVDPIPSVPMRCITVDSPNAMYLAGVAMIPTHNTRCGAEYTGEQAVMNPGIRIAMVGITAADPIRTMVEGESGLLSVLGREGDGIVKKWNRSSSELFLNNGSLFKGYSSEEPENLRGPQHHLLWGDELCAWNNAQHTWDMGRFGLRLGEFPRAVITSTPKPSKLLKALMANKRTVMVTGSTYENQKNLAESFFEELRLRYEGTRLGDQELMAKILEDFDDAYLKNDEIQHASSHPELVRIVIAVDPAGTHRKEADHTGIIAAGVDSLDVKTSTAYVIGDYTIRAAPEEWASRAVSAYHQHEADCIVAEKNYGGEMVQAVINNVDPNVPVRLVTATKGKTVRAEPVCMLYQQGRVVHCGSAANKFRFEELEEQLTAFTPLGYQREGSPDRGDAAVWAIHELILKAREVLLPVHPGIIGAADQSPWILN